jgi:hypothetical protein
LFLGLALLLPLSPLLSPLLFLLLPGGLVLLVLGLTPLLFLRLSVVVAALLLSLAALLIFVTATTFGLRLLRLRPVLIPLLPSLFPRPLTIFAALRLLGPRDATSARQRYNAGGRRQPEATKITDVHDYLLKERAEGKVISRERNYYSRLVVNGNPGCDQLMTRTRNTIWLFTERYRAEGAINSHSAACANQRQPLTLYRLLIPTRFAYICPQQKIRRHL